MRIPLVQGPDTANHSSQPQTNGSVARSAIACISNSAVFPEGDLATEESQFVFIITAALLMPLLGHHWDQNSNVK